MQRIVVFDLAGVICDFRPELRVQAIADASGLSPEHVYRQVWESGLDARADAGEFTAAQYSEQLNEALGADLPQEVYRKAWAASLPINDELLAFVRATPRPTAVFSNNGPLLSDVFDNELAPVADAVDNVVVSWQTGASKPDREAFEALGAILQATPSEMILVDDSETNVNGARAAGIDAIHYTDIENLSRGLRLRHIVVNEAPPSTGAMPVVR
jgi:putative hydrolase of the HAD superfamily